MPLYYNHPVNMAELRSCSGDLENQPGTNRDPVFIGTAPGQKGSGVTFILKVENIYYPMQKTHINKKSINLRCRSYRACHGFCKYICSLFDTIFFLNQ